MKKFLPVLIIAVLLIAWWFYSQDRVSWQRVTLADLKVSMEYPVHSAHAANPFAGTQSKIVAYDHIPSGLKDWTVARWARDRVVATMNCDALKGTGAYLPIDRDQPMQCAVSKGPGGLVTVAVLGLGRPDAGTYYPESMLVFLSEKDARVLTKITPFPLLQKQVNEQVTAFTQTYPNAVIWPPDQHAKKLYTDVQNTVAQAISQPNPEVQSNMDMLKKIAATAQEQP